MFTSHETVTSPLCSPKGTGCKSQRDKGCRVDGNGKKMDFGDDDGSTRKRRVVRTRRVRAKRKKVTESGHSFIGDTDRFRKCRGFGLRGPCVTCYLNKIRSLRCKLTILVPSYSSTVENRKSRRIREVERGVVVTTQGRSIDCVTR